MAQSKLEGAHARLARAAELAGGSVLVALSGGKDSLVTLELCKQHFARVEAFYMYHVRGLACCERSVEAAARRVGVPVHYVPHPDLTRMMRHAVLRPPNPGQTLIKQLKQSDVEAALTAQTGIGWYAYGERAADSFARRLYTRQNDGIRAEWKRIYPIWDWLHGEVISYLKHKRIALPERLGAPDTKIMSGFGTNPRPMHWMKHHAPDDYAKVLAVFPYADVMVMRYELEQARRPAVAPVKVKAVKAKRPPKPKKQKRARKSRGDSAGAADAVSELRVSSGASQRAEERGV